MQPIVDGLETKYGEAVEFHRVNASTTEGLKPFNAYSLFGHPSYLILDEKGEVIWQGVGEQPGEAIESALQDAIEGM